MQSKIIFRVEQDEDGYPPVATEGIWATKAPDDTYILDNIPFFARDATIGDTVVAVKNDGQLWFSCTIARSANSLLRVILHDWKQLDELWQQLENMGCEMETAQIYSIVAVSVPASAALGPIQTYLNDAEAQGWLGYEEAILRH